MRLSRFTRGLRALGELCERLVVVFDEFQRLHACPGEPLSVIRSALMSADRTGRVSLMLTGLRGRLEMMLRDTREPIWDQTTTSSCRRLTTRRCSTTCR